MLPKSTEQETYGMSKEEGLRVASVPAVLARATVEAEGIVEG